ncbi:BspA family leucine-rich repeat surface protein, partial [Alphaproteobacteria bacterium]|nr:BspA family leucine-rich repeat surface protein [Alphaproteobacteria bacterium]
MLFKLIIIIFFNALAFTALSVKASADCYSASSNTIGSSGQCNGMLIVDRTMLDTAIADNSFSITGPDGNLYTFADSAYNIFTGQMTSLYGLFRDKTSFNADIGYWDVSNVTDMTNMFRGATSFNQNIGSWDVSGVVYLDSTFRDASSFNQSLNSWDVSSATHLGSTFKGATDFNGDLSSWDISNVDYAWYTFQDATSFNQNIGGWDTSGVSSLMYMFSGASSFNQNIGSWDVSNVNSFTSMFANATSFNQNLTPWEVSSFDAEPSNFASGAVSWALSKRPLWGIPQLSSSSPADDATGVVVNSNIVLTFNKDVTAGSGSIKLYNANNTLVQEFNVLSDVTFLGTAVRINPTSDFDSSQSY